MSTFTYSLLGSLVSHGEDFQRRPDAIEFVAREAQEHVDRLAEVTLTVDRWGGLEHVAELYARIGEQWSLVAKAMPRERDHEFFIIGLTTIRLGFSEYIRMVAGQSYLLYLPHALISVRDLTLKGVHRIEVARTTRTVRTRRRAWKQA